MARLLIHGVVSPGFITLVRQGLGNYLNVDIGHTIWCTDSSVILYCLLPADQILHTKVMPMSSVVNVLPNYVCFH